MSPTRSVPCRSCRSGSRPDGLLILSTPNATGWSKLITITLAEGLRRGSRKGTHDFDKFIAPERMKQLMANAGLKCLDVEGIAFARPAGCTSARICA